eukprot:gene9775-biopygen7384
MGPTTVPTLLPPLLPTLLHCDNTVASGASVVHRASVRQCRVPRRRTVMLMLRRDLAVESGAMVLKVAVAAVVHARPNIFS